MGVHAFARDARLARIYCDGVTTQQTGGLATDDPWDDGNHKDANAAWQQGFADSLGGVLDLSHCGYPVASAQSPELSENRYG